MNRIISGAEKNSNQGRHPKNYYNVIGLRSGKLVVIKQEPGKGIECLCDCGQKCIEKTTYRVRHGIRTSCGKCSNLSVVDYQESEDRVIRRWAGIKSPEEIAKLVTTLGFRKATKSGIKSRANRLGLSLRRNGELYPFSRISDHDVELCRGLHEEGLGPTEIAEKMELKLTHVHSIIYYRRRTEAAKVAA